MTLRESIIITTRCGLCGGCEGFLVDREAFDNWQKGMFVQDAFPEMLPEDRERLISGICPTCWELLMFGEGEWE